MTMRKIAIATVLLLGAYGCSSDTTAPIDGGDGGKSDAPADMAATEGGGDTGTDAPKDGGAGDASDGGTDGVALTALQARGQYLVDTVIGCSDCHTPRKMDGTPDLSKYLAGNANFVALPNGDKLPSRNLTNHETGLKNRTEAEIKAMVMDGKRPLATGTGTEALNPIMPYYVLHNLKAEDADAIVAYLRVVPGVDNMLPRRSAAFDLPAPVNYLDSNKIPLPQESYAARESALRGRYLAAQSGLCVECHTKHNMTGADVLDTAKLFAGGEDFSAFFASTLMIKPVSKNLTSDGTTGIGNWTVAELVKAMKEGKAKDGSGICPPMPSGPAGYGKLTDGDATDIANYLKSLPPIVNAVPDMCVFPPMMPGDGGADGATDGASEAGAGEGGTDAGSDAAVSEAGGDTAAADAAGN
jgi:hypothetical protein